MFIHKPIFCPDGHYRENKFIYGIYLCSHEEQEKWSSGFDNRYLQNKMASLLNGAVECPCGTSAAKVGHFAAPELTLLTCLLARAIMVDIQ